MDKRAELQAFSRALEGDGGGAGMEAAVEDMCEEIEVRCINSSVCHACNATCRELRRDPETIRRMS